MWLQPPQFGFQGFLADSTVPADRRDQLLVDVGVDRVVVLAVRWGVEVQIEVLDLDVTVEELQAIAENLKIVRREKGQEVEPLIQELDELEGRIEMSFQSEEGRQQGLTEYGD